MDIAMEGIVGEVQFDADEGMILNERYAECEGIPHSIERVILTNKNIWMLYKQKKKGLFTKAENSYIKIALNNISVVNGEPHIDVINYEGNGHVIVIYLTNGKLEIRFDNDEDDGFKASNWRNVINIILVGIESSIMIQKHRGVLKKKDYYDDEEEYDEDEVNEDNKEVNEINSVIPLSYSDNQNSQQGYTSFNVANGEKICDVILKSVGPNKVKEIEVIKRSLNIGLKEAKEIVDSAPTCVLENVPLSVGQRLAEQMSNEGADVHIVIKNIQD